ncbi:hypothetical protein GCM10023081_46690 [Arthrobacter ginkgonis]|uniref:Uncharacterized protein n=1 Tax=Arthrobacter ginkgonis TaxID=1630594 RepID=A0ABP7DLB2_9MICC
MAYTFDPIFAIDPFDPSKAAANAAITIFAPGDNTQAPLTITDTSGLPLANPVTTNADGFAPAFIADLDRVAWIGGGLTGFLTSYEGLKEVATAAADSAGVAAQAADGSRVAAESAGTTAASGAVAAVQAQLGAAVDAASASAQAAQAAALLVDTPAGSVIRQTVETDLDTPGSGLSTRLNAAFVRFVDQDGNPLPAGSVTTIHVNTTTGDIDDITFEEA